MDQSVDQGQAVFDDQSTYLSFEERRWLHLQLKRNNLNSLVKSIADRYKTLPNFPTNSPSQLLCVSHRTALDHPNCHFYYPLDKSNGNSEKIDAFRLSCLCTSQNLFKDQNDDLDFRIFFVILEGFLFYKHRTSLKYQEATQKERFNCLTSLPQFLDRWCKKMLEVFPFIQQRELSTFTPVNKNQRLIGYLFQCLPVISGELSDNDELFTIMGYAQYATKSLSFEELRLFDYGLDVKTSTSLLSGAAFRRPQKPFLWKSLQPSTLASFNSVAIRHNLPNNYPYTEKMVYGDKYPTFWRHAFNQNDDDPSLFYVTAIEKQTDEYEFVEREFNRTVDPKKMSIFSVERIENAILWEKFVTHRKYMQKKNGKEGLNEKWLFHGTDSTNHEQILAHGFNRSYCKDYVAYGYGVYFSLHAAYSCNYSDKEDISFLILARVLVGFHAAGQKGIRVAPPIVRPDGIRQNADSTTNQKENFSIVCNFHDDQNYPEYLISFMRKN